LSGGISCYGISPLNAAENDNAFNHELHELTRMGKGQAIGYKNSASFQPFHS